MSIVVLNDIQKLENIIRLQEEQIENLKSLLVLYRQSIFAQKTKFKEIDTEKNLKSDEGLISEKEFNNYFKEDRKMDAQDMLQEMKNDNNCDPSDNN